MFHLSLVVFSITLLIWAWIPPSQPFSSCVKSTHWSNGNHPLICTPSNKHIGWCLCIHCLWNHLPCGIHKFTCSVISHILIFVLKHWYYPFLIRWIHIVTNVVIVISHSLILPWTKSLLISHSLGSTFSKIITNLTFISFYFECLSHGILLVPPYQHFNPCTPLKKNIATIFGRHKDGLVWPSTHQCISPIWPILGFFSWDETPCSPIHHLNNIMSIH